MTEGSPLYCEEADLKELLGGLDAPCFLYRRKVLEERLRRLRRFCDSRATVFYPVKANPSYPVLELVHQYGFGVDAASAGELRRAREVGVPGSAVLLTGPGKTRRDLMEAVDYGARFVVIESLRELEQLEAVAAMAGREMDVLLRIVPVGVLGHEVAGDRSGFYRFDEPCTKYGLTLAEATEAAAKCATSTSVRLRGVHIFAASGVMDDAVMSRIISRAVQLGRSLGEDWHQELPIVDLGGGFGLEYGTGASLDLEHLAREVDLVRRSCPAGQELIFEPGTWLVGPVCSYVTRVLECRERGGVIQLIVDGGIHHLLRTALVSRHAIVVHGDGDGSTRRRRCRVYGNLCHPMDIMAQEVTLRLPRQFQTAQGMWLEFQNVGAYGPSFAASRFQLRDEPAEVWLK